MDDDYLIAKGWKEGKKRGRLPGAEPPILSFIEPAAERNK